MGCDKSTPVAQTLIVPSKYPSTNNLVPMGIDNDSQKIGFGYYQFSDHYLKLMQEDLRPDPQLERIIDTLQIHDRQDWEGFSKYEGEGGKAHQQNNYPKSVEMFVQCLKCLNHVNACFNLSCELQALKQPRLNIIVHQFAKKIIQKSSNQIKEQYQQKNQSYLLKFQKQCSQKDPLKRNLKASSDFWKLYEQLVKFKQQRKNKDVFLISQELIKIFPCSITGYFQQNILFMNQMKHRQIDYERFKRNITMIERFWKPPFNQPISQENKKLCLLIKGIYCYLTGHIENVRGMTIGLACENECQNRIIRWQQKINDFDVLLRYWNKHRILKMGFAKNSHSQKRLKWQIVSPINKGVIFKETDETWIMERQSIDTPLPKQVIINIQVFIRGVTHYQNGIIPLQPYTGNDPVIQKYTSLKNTKADKKFIDMIINITKDCKSTGEKWDLALEKIRQKIKYEKTEDYQSFSQLWQRGRGVCQQFSKLGEAIGRILGIPSRYVAGYAYFDPKQGITLHSMCQIYSQPLKKWIVTDCQTPVYGTNLSFAAFSFTHDDNEEDCVDGVFFYRNSTFNSSSRQYIRQYQQMIK